MFGRFVDWILLVVSFVGLVVTGWWTVYASPNSAKGLQMQLQERAETMLEAGGHDWARVRLDGQHARVSGQAPSFESSEAVLLSFGEVSPLFTAITKVTSEIASAPPISPYAFNAISDASGELVLTGHVPNLDAMDAVLAKASEIAPGAVTNNLRVGSGQPLGPWQEIALKGLAQLPSLETGAVKLVDSDLMITGTALDDTSEVAIIAALEGLKDPYTTIVDITGPSHWRVRHQRGALVLTGKVANEAQRGELVALAQANYSGNVIDQMEIGGPDYGDWIATARSAMAQFARFQSGDMTFSPESGGFAVKGAATGSIQTYLQQDLVRGTYPVSMMIETVQAEVSELADIDLSAPTIASCQAGFDAIMAANTLRFETGSAIIDRESGATLDKIMSVAIRCGGQTLEIHGHADAFGGGSNNVSLSKQRAEAVKTYLEARGLPAERLQTAVPALDGSIADNTIASGRTANSPVEFKLVEGS